MLACLSSKLGHCSVVIQSRHRGKITWIQIRRVTLGNERVGIRRVANDQHFDIDDEEDGGDEEDRREEEDGGEEEFHDVQQAPVTPETEGDVWIPLFARDSTKKVGGGSQLSTSVRRMMRGSVLLGKRTAKGKVNFSVSFEPIKH